MIKNPVFDKMEADFSHMFHCLDQIDTQLARAQNAILKSALKLSHFTFDKQIMLEAIELVKFLSKLDDD